MDEWAPFLPWHATHSDLEQMEDGIPLGQFIPKLNYNILTPDHWSCLYCHHDNFLKSLVIYFNGRNASFAHLNIYFLSEQDDKWSNAGT